MDYSAANSSLWNIIIQLGLIAGSILVANALRTKVRAIRQAMMPVAVMAGFLLLILAAKEHPASDCHGMHFFCGHPFLIPWITEISSYRFPLGT